MTVIDMRAHPATARRAAEQRRRDIQAIAMHVVAEYLSGNKEPLFELGRIIEKSIQHNKKET